MKKSLGKVYLVGAGPGDPGLLTLRGKELLERAQVVIYDALIDAALLRHAPSAEHIFVGKRPDRHRLPQEDINRLMVEQAKLAACVVRLKGGDPFVFGRGGEEAVALSEAGVPFEVVPGVTAGLGAAAYAGIPITQRGMTDRVTFIMGHRSKSAGRSGSLYGGGKPRLEELPRKGTLVFYMGVDAIEENMDAIHTSGRSLDTPVAVVEWGTLPRQRTIVGTVETIAGQCADAGIDAPAIIVVGEVVELSKKLSWFEARPLFGRRVAVTRTRERAAELVGLLQERGADVLEFPTVEIERPEPQVPLAPLSDYDWVVLTSVNGVDALFEGMAASGQDARDLHGVKLCAISAKTVEALSDRLLRVDVVPERYETEFVVQRLEEHDRASNRGSGISGKRILMPRADIGRSSLPKALRERGAEVDELQAYRTVIPRDAEAQAGELLRYAPHYVTFGSAVSVRNFREILGADRIAQLSGLDARSCHTRYAAIGPIAEVAAKEAGISIDIIPEVHRVPELVEAIVRFDAGGRAWPPKNEERP